MKTDISAKPLDKAEATAFVTSIKKRIGDVREMLIELHDRLGWKALGYDSWEKCVAEEFPHWSKRHTDRERLAGTIQKRIEATSKTGGSKGPLGPKSISAPIPERQLRPLASLPEDQQVSAYLDALEEAQQTGETLTAKHIQVKVDLYKADNEPYVPPPEEPKEEEPAWDAAVAKKAKTALGQLVRALDTLRVDWTPMTLQDIKDHLEG